MTNNKILTVKLHFSAAAYLFVLMTAFSLFTGCNDSREPTAPVEITRPKSNGFEPENGKLGYPVDQPLKIIFTEPMNLATFTNHFTLRDADGNLVNGSFSGKDSVVLFTPSQPLKKATIYFVELRGRLRDAHNNSIEWNGDPVLNDTTLLYKGWFYTEGGYSSGGFFNVYLRDRKGTIKSFAHLDQISSVADSLNAPEGMALSEDGKYLIVTDTKNNQLKFINLTSGTVEAKLPMPKNPSAVAVKGDYAFVVSADVKTISRIKISSRSVESNFVEPFYPGKIAVSNDGSKLYTLDQVKRDLVILNANDGSVFKRLSSAMDKLVTGEIKIDPATGNLYVCDYEGLKLKSTDMDGNSLQTLVTFTGINKPMDVTFDPSNVIVAAGKSIYKYSKSNNALVKTVSFSTNARYVTVLPSYDLIYVTLATSVAIVDASTFTILKEIDLASSGIESIISSQTKF